MREHFKTNRICTTAKYELSIRVYNRVYSNKWDRLFEELSQCKAYINFCGSVRIINRRKANDMRAKGLKVHFM